MKVLILSYFFPPANFVASERTASFARLLPEHGIYPIIVTRAWNHNQAFTYDRVDDNTASHIVKPGYEVYYEPAESLLRDRLFAHSHYRWARVLRRSFSLINLFVANFILKAAPGYRMYQRAVAILEQDPGIGKLIVSISPNEHLFFGYMLKRKFPHLEWMPDYRDEWTTDQSLTNLGLFRRLILGVQRRMERKWTSNSAGFITVSSFLASNIGRLIRKQGHVVMNGFDPPAQVVTGTPPPGELVIIYNGTVYPNQDFTGFRRCLEYAVQKYGRRIRIKVRFVGVTAIPEMTDKLQEVFKGLEEYVELLARVPKEELLVMMAQADIALLTSYGAVRGWYPVKMFDYLSLEKPIFLCLSDGHEIEEFVRDTGGGFIARTEEEACALMDQFIESKLAGKPVSIHINKGVVQTFTRANQTAKLAVLLKNNTA